MKKDLEQFNFENKINLKLFHYSLMIDEVQGLDIQLCSFDLNKKIYNVDDINVSVSIIPDGRIQHFYINGKNFKKEQHSLTVNITDKTEKVVLTFKKHNILLEDSYIGYAIINRNEFIQPKKDSETQQISILKLRTNKRKGRHNNDVQDGKSIVGHINVQFQLMNTFPERKNNGKKLNFEK